MIQELRASFILFVLLFVLTGIVYPLVTMQAAQKFFPHQANGSLIEDKGVLVGSELIGQNFARDDYFHSRPSAAGDKGYDANNSSASNLAPSSPDLIKTIGDRVTTLRKPSLSMPVPIDLVTTSGSGLDPHISPDAAKYQIARVAAARHVESAKLSALVDKFTEDRTFGFLGDARVNVLKLNRALDRP